MGLEIEVVPEVQAMGFEYDGKLHPLLIQHVMEKVFWCLSVKDLMNCRLVCKLWVAYTSPQLRKKRVIEILTANRMRSYIRLMADVDPSEFPDANYRLNNIASDQALTPSRRLYDARDTRHVQSENNLVSVQNELDIYQMRGPNVPQPDNRESPEVLTLRRRFFTLFGSTMMGLELLSSFECSTKDLCELLFELAPNLEAFAFVIHYGRDIDRLFTPTHPFITLTNLKSLGIGTLTSVVVTNTYMQDFFIMTPNLEQLNLEQPLLLHDKGYALQKVTFNEIVRSPTAPTLLHLSKLHVMISLTKYDVDCLTKKGFPLKCLISGFCSDVTGESVNELLISLRKTLTKLGLNIHARSHLARYQFTARCKKLQHLFLCRYRGSLHFLASFPGLKSLRISSIQDMYEVFPLRLEVHPLEELYIHHDPIQNWAITQRIADAFPNLKTFSFTDGSNECMRVIYLQFPHLKKLSVFNGKFSDYGICGIPPSLHKDILESKTLSDADPGRMRVDLSIANLTNLTDLRLEGQSITDIGVMLGVTGCSNLEKLHLQCPLITDNSLFEIARTMKKLCSLNVSQCYSLTEVGKEFINSQMSGVLEPLSGNNRNRDSINSLDVTGAFHAPLHQVEHVHHLPGLGPLAPLGINLDPLVPHVHFEQANPDIEQADFPARRIVIPWNDLMGLAMANFVLSARPESPPPPPSGFIEDDGFEMIM